MIVMLLVTWQLAPGANVIIKAPVATPVSTPSPEPIVASDGLLLVHTPLPTGSVYRAVKPEHTVEGPEIAVGGRLTVTTISVVSAPPLQSVTATLKESRPV